MSQTSLRVTGMRTARMLAEAQLGVSIRMAGMMGLAPPPKGETKRMVDEKTHAFTKAGLAPVARQTRANAKRLTKNNLG